MAESFITIFITAHGEDFNNDVLSLGRDEFSISNTIWK